LFFLFLQILGMQKYHRLNYKYVGTIVSSDCNLIGG